MTPLPSAAAAPRLLPCGRFRLEVGRRTLVMGILNVTPDSFSDGGRYLDVEAAVRRAHEMVEEGADIIDVGGESTRPGAVPVPEEEEKARVLPVIAALAASLPVPVSVDTYKAAVARAALAAGAAIVNDVWGLQRDPEMAAAVAASGAAVVVMHNRPAPDYAGDLMAEIKAFLRESAARARAAGVPDDRLVVDPGFGFGKTPEHNLEVTARLSELRGLGYPVLLGPSRKSTIGKVLDLPVGERLEGTAAVVALAAAQGADIVRVHDVRAMVRVVRMTDAVARAHGLFCRCPGVLAYLGLGANLGDREANLREAVRLLGGTPGIEVLRRSSVYETAPVGVTGQPPFLNQVIEVRTTLTPPDLLARALAVEAALGRVRRERWGPRTIDVDILFYGDETLDLPGLTLPHPRLGERAFVLVPLAELLPERVLPGGERVADAAARLGREAPEAVVRR